MAAETIMMIPKWMGSMPAALMTGNINGARMMMLARASIKVPAMSMTRMMTASSRYLLWETPTAAP